MDASSRDDEGKREFQKAKGRKGEREEGGREEERLRGEVSKQLSLCRLNGNRS